MRRGSGGCRRRRESRRRCPGAVEEALGAEGEGLGVDVGAGVGQPDRRGDVGAGRQRETLDLEVGGEAAPGQRHDRAQAQRLGDHRAQVALLAGLDRVAQARERRRGGAAAGRRSRPAPSPSSRGRRAAGSSAGRAARCRSSRCRPRSAPPSASRGCPRARSKLPLGATLGDLGVKQLVDRLQLLLELGPRSPRRSAGWRAPIELGQG